MHYRGSATAKEQPKRFPWCGNGHILGTTEIICLAAILTGLALTLVNFIYSTTIVMRKLLHTRSCGTALEVGVGTMIDQNRGVAEHVARDIPLVKWEPKKKRCSLDKELVR